MDNHKLSRRQFLKATGAMIAVASAIFLWDRPWAYGIADQIVELDEDQIVYGTIENIDSSGVVYLNSQESMVSVQFSSDSIFSRGNLGHVRGVNDFVIGDQVVAEGEWNGDVFQANALMSIYLAIEGTILTRTNNHLETSAGTLLLTPETRASRGNAFVEKPLDDLATGDEIGAMVWREPGVGDFIVLRIGVRGEHSGVGEEHTHE